VRGGVPFPFSSLFFYFSFPFLLFLRKAGEKKSAAPPNKPFQRLWGFFYKAITSFIILLGFGSSQWQ
jgi:hypothetical protein